jgi:tetratricopeptide (TPR) repeat protein
MHDLLRAYAAELAAAIDTGTAATEAVGRTLDHYLHTGWDAILAMERASRPEHPPRHPGAEPEPIAGKPEAREWLSAEHEILRRLVVLSSQRGFDAHVIQLSLALTLDSYIRLWAGDTDLAEVNEVALSTAIRTAHPAALACAYFSLGFASSRSARLDESVSFHRKSLTYFEQIEDPVGRAAVHLALSESLYGLGQLDEALHHAEQAETICDQTGFRESQRMSLAMAGWLHTALGNPALGREIAQRGIDLQPDPDDRGFHTVFCLIAAGHASLELGDLSDAIGCCRRAIGMCETYEFSAIDHAYALFCLGDACEAAQDLGAARQAWRAGLNVLGVRVLRPPGRSRWGDHAERIRAKLEALQEG